MLKLSSLIPVQPGSRGFIAGLGSCIVLANGSDSVPAPADAANISADASASK
jgi:hypothetical protein